MTGRTGLSAVVCLTLTFGIRAPARAGQSSSATRDSLVDVGGYRLQFHITPGNSPSILFEAGGGDDSSVWADVAAQAHARTGARTITYDRAGFGKSEAAPGPYDVDAEIAALQRGLVALHIDDNVVLVSHSYGGFLATLFAAKSPRRVSGAVFVDANHVSFFTDEIVTTLMASIPSAAMDQMRKTRPAMARMLEAMPATVKRLRTMEFPRDVQTIDIVSETGPLPDPESSAAWRHAHQQFVSISADRSLVVATGSGHFVMRDKPGIVIESIVEVYGHAEK